jgi:hypothetical protein
MHQCMHASTVALPTECSMFVKEWSESVCVSWLVWVWVCVVGTPPIFVAFRPWQRTCALASPTIPPSRACMKWPLFVVLNCTHNARMAADGGVFCDRLLSAATPLAIHPPTSAKVCLLRWVHKLTARSSCCCCRPPTDGRHSRSLVCCR